MGVRVAHGRMVVISVLLLVGLVALSAAGAQATTVFSDDFEARFSGWTTSGTPDWYTGLPKNGTHCVQLARKESLQRTISTQGYDSITVSFYLGAKSLKKNGNRIDVLWYNGSSWNLLKRIARGDADADGELHYFAFSLPENAAGLTRFALRVSFTAKGNGGDRGYVDDILVSGEQRNYTLNLSQVGNGTVSVDGTPQTMPWSASYPYGTVVSLQAVAGPGYRFGAWTGDLAGSAATTSVTMNGDKTITANFIINQYVLNLTGNGQVTVDGATHDLPWSGIYDYGTTVTLAAVSDAGRTFVSWSGDLSGTTNPTDVTMDRDLNIAAAFTVNQYHLNLSGDGHGSVVVDGVAHSLPWSGLYDYGTAVAVEAYPDDGYRFDGWTGDYTGADNPAMLTVNGDMSVTAHFVVEQCTLSLQGSGGSVKVDGVAYSLPVDLVYDAGTDVTVEAVPDACGLFLGWADDATGWDNPLPVYMDSDLLITADFATTAIFSDVDCTYWAAREIASCHYAGIVNGYWDGTFRPTLVVARDQMAVFISRALAGGDAGVPSGPETASFPDVPTDYWAYRYVEYAKAIGIVGGYWDGYRPTAAVDRGQMAVFVSRSICPPLGEAGLTGYTPPATPSFADVPTDFWAYKYIEYAHSRGVVNGYWDGYHPADPVTRDQMAVYVARAFDLPR